MGIVLLEEGHDVGAQGSDAAIDAPPDLALSDEGKEALDLVEPRGLRWICQRGLLRSQLRISGVLWVA